MKPTHETGLKDFALTRHLGIDDGLFPIPDPLDGDDDDIVDLFENGPIFPN